MRLHHTEVDLSRHARPRLAAQEERDPQERVAEIERALEARGPGERTVVGRPVRQGDSQLFDAQRGLGVRQGAQRVRRANESVGAGGRRRGQQTADPLSEHDPPGGFGELGAKKGHPVSEPVNGAERLCPVFCRDGRTGRRHRIELPPVSVRPGDHDVVAAQRDQRLGGHRAVIGRAAARDFAPGSS
jgi:hypothetical protein